MMHKLFGLEFECSWWHGLIATGLSLTGLPVPEFQRVLWAWSRTATLAAPDPPITCSTRIQPGRHASEYESGDGSSDWLQAIRLGLQAHQRH